MGSRGRWLIVLAAYGVLNAALYASVMPLWEGFDEPFHYAYVDWLARHGSFPVTGEAPLTAEVWESLHLAPGSYLVKRNLPFVTEFSAYFALPVQERAARRERLESLSPELRFREVEGTSNYEAQQPPLAYLAMVLPDCLWAGVPLPGRILLMRLFCGVAGVLLTLFVTLWLGALLELPSPARYAAVFVVLSAQMLYACVAHVANEWLAIPMIVLVLIAAIRFRRDQGVRSGAFLGAAVAAALLSKAYALSWGAFGVGVLVCCGWRDGRARLAAAVGLGIVLVCAGPWYARNLWLYGNVSGSILMAARAGNGGVLRVLPGLPWVKIGVDAAHSGLWTGNSSFTSFSVGTLNLILGLMAVAGAMWLGTVRGPAGGTDEWLVAVGCAAYVPALMYYCGMSSAFGQAASVAPWYLGVLIVPVTCLLLLGCARAGRWGNRVALGFCGLSAYVLSATYFLKLIPMYGGYRVASVRFVEILRWYLYGGVRQELLADIVLGSPGVVWVLAGLVTVMSWGIGGRLAAVLSHD